MWLRVFVALIFSTHGLCGQEGDKPGETQVPLVPKEKIPPAPALSPEQALNSFQLQPGFRIELVAAEPLVQDPVQLVFDPAGRLWVLEMRGFMPNIDGTGELEKVGSVAVLEDTDDDGKVDKRTVFLDELVMPRALALVRGGALVAEPPNLWFCQDTDGDGRCDKKTLIANDYAIEGDPRHGPRANVEHTANGLLWAIDNWIYSANYSTRFRNTEGTWRREPAGRNVQPLKDQSVWPIRVNPGVNRGYQKGELRPNASLAHFTAACAPLVYRGDNFPAEYHGNVFLCEPAGNLVRRNVLTEQNLNI